MRICIETAEYPPSIGGIGTYVYNVARTLSRRGHKVVVITRGGWNRAWDREITEGVEVYRVRYFPVYPFHVWLHGIFVNKLLQDLQLEFDIVHLNTPLLANLKKLSPYVATQQGTIMNDIKMRKTLDLFSLVYKLLQYPLISIDRTISKNATNVIAVSRGVAQELVQLYGISQEKIIVIPSGVDTHFFTPLEKPTSISPYILYSGRLDARKGIQDFVEAAGYICREKPAAMFIVAGSGPMETSVKRQVHAANLDTNFQFTGFVNQKVLVKYYREASVLIMPSYYEGMPHSLLEAMSCAVPCIVTNVGGNNEAVVDGESGLLVPTGNPARIAEATLRLLNNEPLRKELGNNARKRALEYFDWDIVVDKIECLYRNFLDKH